MIPLLLIAVSALPASAADPTPAGDSPAVDTSTEERFDLSPGPVYFDRSREGWFWFRGPKIPKKEIAPNPNTSIPERLPPTMKEIREMTQKLLDRAWEEPTQENLHAYLAYQQLIFNRNDRFVDAWRRVLIAYPELDPSVDEPTVTAGLSIARAEKTRRQDEKLFALAQTKGLLYFFSANCPLCEVQSPILATFVSSYGFPVVAISVDGSEEPLVGPARVDLGAAARLGVTKTPALFLADPKSGEIVRVGTGLLSVEDLGSRLLLLTQAPNERNQEMRHEEQHEIIADPSRRLPGPLAASGGGETARRTQ